MSYSAFPDYGTVQIFKQYTMEGFLHASHLFALIAGEGSAPSALHYIAITMATIGALALLVLPTLQKAKIIASWLFIVFVLIVYPKENPLAFVKIPNLNAAITVESAMQSKSEIDAVDVAAAASSGIGAAWTLGKVINNYYADEAIKEAGHGKPSYVFAPQAVVIDLLSRIQRAVFVAFYTTDGSGRVVPMNLEAAISGAMGMKDMKGATFSERFDLQQEIRLFDELGCGAAALLGLRPYDASYVSQHNVAQGLVNAKGGTHKLPLYALSRADDVSLKNKTFTLLQVKEAIESFKRVPDKPGVFPPFAVVQHDLSGLSSVYADAGVSASKQNALRVQYGTGNVNGEEVAKAAMTMPYLFTTPEIMAEESTVSSADYFVDQPSVKVAEITISDVSFVDAALGILPWNSAEPHAVFKQENPVSLRVQGTRTVQDFPRPHEEKQWETWRGEKDKLKPDLRVIPVSIGFVTPSLKRAYSIDVVQSWVRGGQMSQNPSLQSAADKNGFYVVSTCQQFHAILHRRLREAVVYQSGWAISPLAALVSNKAFNSDINGFRFNQYPFDPLKGIPYTSSGMMNDLETVYDRLQSIKPVLRYGGRSFLDGEGGAAGTEYHYAMNMAKRMLVSDLIQAGINQTSFVMLPDRAYTLAGKGHEVFSEEHVSSKMPWGGQALGAIGVNIADPAVNIFSFFTGGEVLVYIKFLKYMVGIAIFFVLLVTPLYMMMGLLVPAFAPGIIAITVVTLLVLKTIPITFMLVDFVMGYAANSYDAMGFTDGDRAVMIGVMAAAYTSVVSATMFLLFKAGDVSTIMGSIQGIDGHAKQIGESVNDLSKTIAKTGALMVAGAAGAGLGAAAKTAAAMPGASTGAKIAAGAKAGGKQMFGAAVESFKDAPGNIPVLGDLTNEAIKRGREGAVKSEGDRQLRDQRVFSGDNAPKGFVDNMTLGLFGETALAERKVRDAKAYGDLKKTLNSAKTEHLTEKVVGPDGIQRRADIAHELEENFEAEKSKKKGTPEQRQTAFDRGKKAEIEGINEEEIESHVHAAATKEPAKVTIIHPDGTRETLQQDSLLDKMRDAYRDQLNKANDSRPKHERLAPKLISKIAESMAIERYKEFDLDGERFDLSSDQRTALNNFGINDDTLDTGRLHTLRGKVKTKKQAEALKVAFNLKSAPHVGQTVTVAELAMNEHGGERIDSDNFESKIEAAKTQIEELLGKRTKYVEQNIVLSLNEDYYARKNS